jgi:PAS domain S-box-containing protein
LERDLSETRDYLQSIQEQHEAANEELQASNEEVQSANEELQSTNEELETSKEELESTNEELTTVNEEMANRNFELNRLNSDLVNLQTSTHLPIVLLGRDMTIRRFSAQAEKRFNLLASDVGRPISGMRHNLDLTDLETLVGEIITSAREREREVRDKEGRWYSLRVHPYQTLDDKVDGAVLVLVDIDALKRTEVLITEARDYAEAIIRTVSDPLLILNADLRVHTANEAFYKAFEVSPAETEDRSIFELDRGSWSIPRLRHLLEDILPRHSFFNNFEVTHEFERIGPRTMLLNARTLSETSGQPARILLGIQDITELLQFQRAMRQSQSRYRALVEASAQIVWTTDASGAVVEDSPSWRAFTGQTYEQWKGFGWLDVFHPDDRERVTVLWQRAVSEHTPLEIEYRIRHVSGDWRWMAARAVPVLDSHGSVSEWVGMNSDITERKQAEERQRFLMNELAHRGQNLLAVIQSIASRTLSGTRSLAEAHEVLTQRIQALARSQSVLVTEDFEGAPVTEIIRLEFEAFSERVKAVGPDVMLNPRAAQTFALLVHELATNATKHGALSRPGGQIAIHWSIEGAGSEARFKFQWQERDGPPVVPPTHQGFGRILLEKAAAQDFGAPPKIRFAPEGLSYEIDAPLSVMAAGSTLQ